MEKEKEVILLIRWNKPARKTDPEQLADTARLVYEKALVNAHVYSVTATSADLDIALGTKYDDIGRIVEDRKLQTIDIHAKGDGR